MKKFTKLLCLLLVLCITTLGVAGCSGNKPADSSLQSDASTPPVDVPPDTMVLKMATSSDMAPYVYKQDSKLTGIDIEVAEAIAAELGCTLEFINTDPASITGLVQDGSADFGMGRLAVTEEESLNVNFTASYITDSASGEAYSIAVKKGSSLLLDKINVAIETLKSNGTIDKIAAKHEAGQ